jgi:hypothetical protein
MMQHSPAEIGRQLLVNLGVGQDPDGGTSPTWPVFTGQEPDGIGVPDECITVYDTTWRTDGRHMGNGQTYWHYGIQIRLRSLGQADGWLKARAV